MKLENMEQLQTNVNDLCDRFWQWRMKSFPEFATNVGMHKYDDRLNDLSLESIKLRACEAGLFLEEVKLLELVNEENSSPTSMNLELLKIQLETFVTGNEYRSYLCPINRLEGPQFDFPRLLTHMKKNTVEDFSKILTRLSILDVQIYQIIDLMKEGIRSKLTLHEVSIAPVPTQLKNIVNEPLNSSSLGKCFLQRPSSITESKWEMIVEKASSILETRIVPAFTRLADFITNDYIQHTRSSLAVTSLPMGKLIYQAYLKYHTSSNMTPEDIHEVGLKEVKRITTRMNEICTHLQFDTLKDLKEFVNMDCYKDADDLLNQYTNICKDVWHKLPKMFLTLPKETCMLKVIPKEQQQYSPSAFYKEGNENTAGIFWINTREAKTRAKYRAMALALHEGIPGHHLQSDIFLRKKSNLKFRRFIEGGSYHMIPGRFPLYTAFMEGWGLYAEYLGEKMQMYTNAVDLFGRLQSEMLRAARLVVDTGLHAFQWTKQQAVEYMVDYAGLTFTAASSEVDRYVTWPGQACSYKIGELKFHELRNKAQQLLKEDFDIRIFHEVVLCNGAVPLNMLEQNVNKYINTIVIERK